MKELFIPKTFTPDSEALLVHIQRILVKYAAQGYDLSLRQLYYQLVAGDLLPQKWADPATGSTNSERSYKNIGNLVSDARLAGLIDWDAIKDRGRECETVTTWPTIGAIVRACANQFKFNLWENQPKYVEVMVEKQALEGVLLPVCREWQVPFTANKGYSSSSALYEAGQRLATQSSAGKEIHVIYLGDHDPSGMDMTRDIEERLALFSRLDPSEVNVHRVALNMDQVRQLNPPENPAKITDSRAAGYIERFGRKSWELDAIEPRALAGLVRDQIHELVDHDEWAEGEDRIQDARDKLSYFANQHES